MFKIDPVSKNTIDMEPGDGTHYKFIVSKTSDLIYCASVNEIVAHGWGYDPERINNFVEEYPYVVQDYGYYDSCLELVSGHHYIKYIAEHCKGQLWTALAIIRACYLYMTTAR